MNFQFFCSLSCKKTHEENFQVFHVTTETIVPRHIKKCINWNGEIFLQQSEIAAAV